MYCILKLIKISGEFMKKIFLDDKRTFDIAKKCGYNCIRTYQQCITLLSVLKNIDVINLDYDLGSGKTGLDVLIYMKQNNIKVKEIYIHSTHLEGVKMMEKFIKQNFKDVNYLYCPYSE